MLLDKEAFVNIRFVINAGNFYRFPVMHPQEQLFKR